MSPSRLMVIRRAADFESTFQSLDKFLQAAEEPVRAGALLGMALTCAVHSIGRALLEKLPCHLIVQGTRNLDIDPCFALLSEHVEQGSASTHMVRI